MNAAPPLTTTDAFLGGKLQITQPAKGYRAGSDAVFLAAACPALEGDSVLELGCGVGTALLCLGTRIDAKLTGVERAPQIADLARANSTVNSQTTEIITADIESLPAGIKQNRYNHVMMNPPFFDNGSASADSYRDLARREQTPLATWIDTGLKRVAPGGTLTLIHRAARLSDLLSTLNSHALRLEILPLTPRQDRPASTVILRAQRSGIRSTTLHNPLIMHKGAFHEADRSDFTPAARAVLWDGQALNF